MLNAEKILSLALAHDFETIAAEARREIALEAAKERGGATMAQRTKKALSYIKAVERDNLRGAVIQDEKQCFSNGYTAFMLNDLLPGLPDMPGEAPDFSRWIPAGGEAVEDLPAQLAEARRLIAEFKASATKEEKRAGIGRKSPIVISKCGYNPQYLLDVCAILGGDITMYQDDNKPTSPARLESENGIAILLPVRLAQ